MIPLIVPFVKQKKRRPKPPFFRSSLAEGFAVGTLIHGRIAFVGTHLNVIQRAVVLGIAVVRAGLDGTLNALIGFAVHSWFLLCFGF